MIRLSTTAYLAGALAISIAGNAYQLHRAGVKSAEAEHTIALARAEGRAESAAQVIALNEALAAGKTADLSDLLATLAKIAERGQKTRILWRQAEAQPLPEGCGPGQARIDAVNAHLGPVR